MRAFVFAVFALTACAPQPQTPPSSAPDPLGVRYEVRVGQTVLPDVRSVEVTGPDAELVEVRIPGGPATLVPGRVGAVRLMIATDWSAAERTMETWRAGVMNVTVEQPLSLQRQTVTVVITGAGGATATYAFQRCLPNEHRMQMAAQDGRIEQVRRITCEGVLRS
jgi:hypothetical protein